jgi:hypothetical protein
LEAAASPKKENVIGTDNKMDNDAALDTIFSVIVLFLGKTSNTWWKPAEIDECLRAAGVSAISGFEVSLALNKY